MRVSNIELVERIKEEHSLPEPVYDIGGGDSKSMWYFPVVSVDMGGNVDIRANCMDMPQIKDGVAGSVITTDTFEHLQDPFKAIKEIHRIMKPGGILVLSTVFLWDYHKVPEDYFRFSVPALEYLCKDFEKIESGWSYEELSVDTKRISCRKAGSYFVGKKK